MTKRVLTAIGIVTAAAILLTACTSSGSKGHSGARLIVGVFDPFSGPNAGYGYAILAGCATAVDVINHDGGVLGHKLTCQIFDNHGDPADAGTAAARMVVTPNLIGIVDSDSGLAPGTVPLFERAHITDFSSAGDVSLDKSHYKYFWRVLPSDDAAGYAIAAWASLKAYKRVALIFGNDVPSQGNVPPILAGLRNLHITVTSNQSIVLDQSTYETEIQQLLASHPQAIAMEADPQTSAVLFSELKQAGSLMPIFGGLDTPQWTQTVSAAIGATDTAKYITIVDRYVPQSGSLWRSWKQALLASCARASFPGCRTQVQNPYSEAAFDAIQITALAMIEAKSTNSSSYNRFVRAVTATSPGAVVVHSYRQGESALRRGKSIQYVGVTQAWDFNRYQNNSGSFAGYQAVTGGTEGLITPRMIVTAQGG